MNDSFLFSSEKILTFIAVLILSYVLWVWYN